MLEAFDLHWQCAEAYISHLIMVDGSPTTLDDKSLSSFLSLLLPLIDQGRVL